MDLKKYSEATYRFVKKKKKVKAWEMRKGKRIISWRFLLVISRLFQVQHKLRCST